MQLFFYGIIIRLYGLAIWLASPVNTKAKSWISGRRQQQLMPSNLDVSDCIWMHCASVGEYEQGLPIFQQLKKRLPKRKTVISFFSPSGYELLQHQQESDLVLYLPLDTRQNARAFLDQLNPAIAVFVKYEFWINHLLELKDRGIATYLVCGIFRPDQIFFKPYGTLFRTALKSFDQLYVQNRESQQLLGKINLNKVTVSSDSRFDRVLARKSQVAAVPFVEQFLEGKKAFVAGSTWKQDHQLLCPLILKSGPEDLFIIVPHEINEEEIRRCQQSIPEVKSVRSSQKPNSAALKAARVLIVDELGLLFSIYQYAYMAYIGGGFGAGIHNTLEAAVFCLPLVFGPRYQKFQEAVQLIEIAAAVSVQNEEQLQAFFASDNLDLQQRGDRALQYVKSCAGGSETVARDIANRISELARR